MKATLHLDMENAEQIYQAVNPDLQDSDRVQFNAQVDNGLHIDISADSLGVLQGAVNTALRLTKLSSKLLGD